MLKPRKKRANGVRFEKKKEALRIYKVALEGTDSVFYIEAIMFSLHDGTATFLAYKEDGSTEMLAYFNKISYVLVVDEKPKLPATPELPLNFGQLL